MLNSIIRSFSSTVYIQIWESRIKINLIGSTAFFDEQPFIAIDSANEKKPTIMAVGNKAYEIPSSDTLRVFNPFSHPRLLVNGFEKAEKILQHGVRHVCGSKIFSPSPIVVIHPREKLEGGLTDIECRVFKELAYGAGAREVHLHVGNELQLHEFNLDAVQTPKQS